MSRSTEFSQVDGFSCGAIGPKGKRVFFVQVREGAEVLSLKLEKQQVTALAEFLDNTLEELFGYRAPRPPSQGSWLDSLGGGEVPPAAPPEVEPRPSDSPEVEPRLSDYDEPYFEQPSEPDWVVGKIGAAYQQNKDFIILWMEELTQNEDDAQSTARFALKADQASNFVRQARTVVAAGRPPCPYCRAPLNSEDGFCPCWN